MPLWWRGYGFAVTDTVFASRHGLLCAAVCRWCRTRRCRVCGCSKGPGSGCTGVADVHVETGANKTVTARLRDASEAAELLYGQADRSRTGRREARPDRWMA